MKYMHMHVYVYQEYVANTPTGLLTDKPRKFLVHQEC